MRDLGRLRQPEQAGRLQIETLGPEEAAVRFHRTLSIAETIAEPHPSARARPPVVVPGHAVRDLGRLRQPEQAGRLQIETLGPEEAAVRFHRAPLIAKLAEAGVFGETAGDLVELRGGRLLESDEIRCVLANRVDDQATTMRPGLAAIGRLVVADVECHRTHASRSRRCC